MAASARAVFTLLLVCGLVSSAAATIYNVGEDGGWTFQSQNSTFYDDQFKNITLFAGTVADPSAGDGLNFTFITGQHNVIQISPEAVANCDLTSPINSSLVQFTFYSHTPGTVGLVCGFPSHCSLLGMHLTVTFVSPESPAPSPAGEGG